MSTYLKPQSPLYHKTEGAYFYPLTTIDQVILEDGSRLNSEISKHLVVDIKDANEAEPNLINANTLNGKTESELSVANAVNANTLGGKTESELFVANAVNADMLGGYAASDYAKNVSKAGFIYPLASSVVPEGFLLCNGAAYLRSEYPELFAAIGTIYGSGDGSTTFNVPNLQTRVPVGAGDNYELGSVGGEANHNHNYGIQYGAYYENISLESNENAGILTYDSNGNITIATSEKVGSLTAATNSSSTATTTETSMSHYRSIGTTSTSDNMQPYTVINYIIATGKNTGVSVADVVAGAQALPLGVEYGGTGANNITDIHKNLQIRATAVNLLDNSDFANPVNQRGETSYSSQVYGIDRWYGRTTSQTVSVENLNVKVSATATAYAGIKQKIENIANYAGKTLTLACRVYSTESVAIGFVDASDTALKETVDNNSGFRIVICTYEVPSDATVDTVIPRLLLRTTAADDYMRLYWAALYEGEYTAETLPVYQPKGYSVELSECQRYYQVFAPGYIPFGYGISANTTATSLRITFPCSPMRIKPTVTFTGTLNNIRLQFSEGSIQVTSITSTQYSANSSFVAIFVGVSSPYVGPFSAYCTSGNERFELSADL